VVKSELTSSFFKTYLSYNESTGKFFWLERPDSMFDDWRQARRWNGHFAGKECGSVNMQPDGYCKIKIGLVGKTFALHRVAALYLDLIETYGNNKDIDHIDGNPLNNKAENLRACSRSINLRNHKISSKNTSGITGVSFHRHSGKFNASVRDFSKRISLGYFDTIFEAACARRSWELLRGYTKRHI
jgi:hypothetical protein